MKKYNRSEIMKRAWELVKKTGMTISEGLKKAWQEAKTVKETAKKQFNGFAKFLIQKEEGAYRSFDKYDFYYFKLWVGGNGIKRIYANDYKGRTFGYIDLEYNAIVTDYKDDSAQVKTMQKFMEEYVF